jgi:hypothetical protein
VIQQWSTGLTTTATDCSNSTDTVAAPEYSYAPALVCGSSYSAQSSDVANDMAAKSTYLQLQVMLLYSGNLCNEFIHWHNELHAYTGDTSAVTVATSLHELSHWRSYYAQQHCAVRLPVIDHLIQELHRFNAIVERCTAVTGAAVNDTEVLHSWSTSLIQESHAAYARLKQVC